MCVRTHACLRACTCVSRVNGKGRMFVGLEASPPPHLMAAGAAGGMVSAGHSHLCCSPVCLLGTHSEKG